MLNDSSSTQSVGMRPWCHSSSRTHGRCSKPTCGANRPGVSIVIPVRNWCQCADDRPPRVVGPDRNQPTPMFGVIFPRNLRPSRPLHCIADILECQPAVLLPELSDNSVASHHLTDVDSHKRPSVQSLAARGKCLSIAPSVCSAGNHFTLPPRLHSGTSPCIELADPPHSHRQRSAERSTCQSPSIH